MRIAKQFWIFLFGMMLILCFPIPSVAQMEIGFYGFAKLDVLEEDRITGNLPEIPPDNVPLNDDPADHHSQTIIDARNSRLGVKATAEVYGIDMLGVIEGDFFTLEGNAEIFNSRVFRVRHAYGSAFLSNGLFFLIGQYWTLLTDVVDIPMPSMVNTEFTPVGTPLARQPQIRLGYKKRVFDIGDIVFQVTVEKHAFNPIGFITPEDGDPFQGSEQRWPLFAGKISWLTDQFKWSVIAAGAQSIAIINKKGKEVDTGVWTVISTASYTWEPFTLWMTIHHSVGLSRIFLGLFNDVEVGDGSSGSSLLPITSNGGTVGLKWDYIEDVLWFDLLYGWDHALKEHRFPKIHHMRETFKDFRINAFYKFWKYWQVGIEYQKIMVKAFNGKKGNVDAFHLGIWYFFGEPPPI